jgi:glutathione synthase/RimK-type ligase-like ATP-grasp enzyme
LRRQPRIISDNSTLSQHYHVLEQGDIICCRLRLKPGEDHLLLDLSRRGIIGIPSLSSQLCSRSKAFQTRLFSWAMVPATTVIYTMHDLLQAMAGYGQAGVSKVVVKLEGKNGGLGVFLYPSIEDVYSQSALGSIPYPYVMQPFVSDCRDLRVIVIGDYWEAYERSNPYNFRHNLHCGGAPTPVALSVEQQTLCRRIMAQGEFRSAHIDLMITADGRNYFTEINLRGGLRGARINSEEYQQRLADLHERWCASLVEQAGAAWEDKKRE